LLFLLCSLLSVSVETESGFGMREWRWEEVETLSILSHPDEVGTDTIGVCLCIHTVQADFVVVVGRGRRDVNNFFLLLSFDFGWRTWRPLLLFPAWWMTRTTAREKSEVDNPSREVAL
jgi:hypothetical protein